MLKEVKKFLGLTKKDDEKKILYLVLIIIGGLILAGLVGYAVYQFLIPLIDRKNELKKEAEKEEEESFFEE